MLDNRARIWQIVSAVLLVAAGLLALGYWDCSTKRAEVVGQVQMMAQDADIDRSLMQMRATHDVVHIVAAMEAQSLDALQVGAQEGDAIVLINVELEPIRLESTKYLHLIGPVDLEAGAALLVAWTGDYWQETNWLSSRSQRVSPEEEP